MDHMESTPRPVTEFRSDLPPELVTILGRMMAKQPALRYQTPAEAARLLVPLIKAAAASREAGRSGTKFTSSSTGLPALPPQTTPEPVPPAVPPREPPPSPAVPRTADRRPAPRLRKKSRPQGLKKYLRENPAVFAVLVGVALGIPLVIAILALQWLANRPKVPGLDGLPSQANVRPGEPRHVPPPEPRVGTQVGDLAPEIKGKNLEGKHFSLADFRGKVVLVDFWADWCPFCKRMYPYEVELSKRMAGKPFTLLGVNSDPERDIAKEIVQIHGMTWPTLWEGPAQNVTSRWGVESIPTLFVLDHRGVIRMKQVGALSETTTLDRLIDQVVAEIPR
jgi:thiol-disulfide isomerase/thioredoxin